MGRCGVREVWPRTFSLKSTTSPISAFSDFFWPIFRHSDAASARPHPPPCPPTAILGWTPRTGSPIASSPSGGLAGSVHAFERKRAQYFAAIPAKYRVCLLQETTRCRWNFRLWNRSGVMDIQSRLKPSWSSTFIELVTIYPSNFFGRPAIPWWHHSSSSQAPYCHHPDRFL